MGYFDLRVFQFSNEKIQPVNLLNFHLQIILTFATNNLQFYFVPP